MPLPLLFIGVAAATGTFGVGKTIKAGIDATKAKHINMDKRNSSKFNRIFKCTKICLWKFID